MVNNAARVGKNQMIIQILHYLMAGVIILNQHTMWRYLEGIGEYTDLVMMLALVIATVVCMAFQGALHPKGKVSYGFVVTFAVMMYMTVFTILNPTNRYYFAEFAIGVLVIGIYYFTCNKDTLPEVFRAYANIVTVIAAISLLLWILCSVFKVMPPTGTVMTGWNPTGDYQGINSYFGIYFEPQEFYLSDLTFYRNCSCFAEAPMASLAFSIGMLIELFLAKKAKVVKVAILYLTIISTCSVTGILIGTTAIIIKLSVTKFIPGIRSMQNQTKKRLIICAIICFVFVVAAVLVYIFIFKINTRSGSIRIDDFKVGVKAWLDAPVIGHGYMNNYCLVEYMHDWREGNFGFSNSVTQLLAHGGIFLGVMYLAAFVAGIVRSVRKKRWQQLCFVVLSIIMFCAAIWTYTFILILLLYYFAFDGIRLDDHCL